MKKIALLTAGWVLLLLGGIGLLVPVLPTTPFVLVAAGCFSCASERMYRLLLRSRFFGPYIENYRTKQGVPVDAKVRGIVMLWVLLGISMLAMQKLWLTLLLLGIGAAVTAHLLLLKTRPSGAMAEAVQEEVE